MLLLYTLALCQTDHQNSYHAPRRQPAPAVARTGVERGGRAGRFFQSRVKHDSNSTSTFNISRLISSGDVELNPGPARQRSHKETEKSLKILTQNVRSVRNKLGDLRASAPELVNYDVVAWTETWLNSSVDSAELVSALPGHTWYRRDRPTHAGGVACAVRANIPSSRREDLEADGTEMLVVEMGTIPKSLFCVMYCPPGNGEILGNALDMLCNIVARYPTMPVLCTGDFNTPDVKWSAYPDSTVLRPRCDRLTQRAMTLIEKCDVAGFNQYVSVPTRGENFLDLLFARHAIVETSVRGGTFESDHAEICAVAKSVVCRQLYVNRATALNYKRADFEGMRRSLQLIPWDSMLNVDVNEAVDTFYDVLGGAIRDYIPTVTLRRNCPPWFDAEVKRALKEKETAFKRMKRNHSSEAVNDFENKRRDFKSLSGRKYFEYLRGMIGDFKNNPKRFWSFLKCVRGKTGQIPVLMDGQREVTGDVERANLLNRTFASKFSNPEVTKFPETLIYDLPTLNRLFVSEDRVRSILNELNVHKACGPDNVSARVIWECRAELAHPLTILFGKSLERGVFPGRWAEANIVPIYKKGCRKLPENYRSISLLPLFGKILERCVYDILLNHVRPILDPRQHGFVPNRSCDTNLATLLKTAWESLSSGHQTDVIYTDYSAAFQSVNHKLLLYKLERSFNVSGSAIQWLKSFLTDRKQRVTVNGRCSTWTSVRSGTPEGSQLSPLLFALFVNDLPDKIQTNILLFADDVKLYHKITCPLDSKLLQSDLNWLVTWSKDWNLNLNPSKCHSFRMTLKRNPVLSSYKIHSCDLQHVGKVRDLGVWLDTKLTFSAHIDFIAGKANRALGVLIRSLQTSRTAGRLQTGPILAAYFGNIRSIMEYGCVIWGGAAPTHLKRLDRIQHKFLSWLSSYTSTFRASSSPSYQHLLNLFKVCSLEKRRFQYDVCFVHKVVRGRVDSAFLLGCFPLHVPQRRTRAGPAQLLHVPSAHEANKETIRRGLFRRAVLAFNEHVQRAADPFRETLTAFKASVKKYVQRNPF